jgi:hypothetical protein
MSLSKSVAHSLTDVGLDGPDGSAKSLAARSAARSREAPPRLAVPRLRRIQIHATYRDHSCIHYPGAGSDALGPDRTPWGRIGRTISKKQLEPAPSPPSRKRPSADEAGFHCSAHAARLTEVVGPLNGGEQQCRATSLHCSLDRHGRSPVPHWFLLGAGLSSALTPFKCPRSAIGSRNGSRNLRAPVVPRRQRAATSPHSKRSCRRSEIAAPARAAGSRPWVGWFPSVRGSMTRVTLD